MFDWLRNRRKSGQDVRTEQPGSQPPYASSSSQTIANRGVAVDVLSDQNVEPVRCPLNTNCFSLLQPVLDELYARLQGECGERTTQLVGNALIALGRMYRGTVFNYNRPLLRFAYLYKYAAGRATMLYQVMRKSSKLRSLMEQDAVKVACIGGGPGTDVLSMVKLCERCKGRAIVNATVFDAEPGWDEYWRLIEATCLLQDHARVEFVPVNALSLPSTAMPMSHYEVITLSYCVSELCSDERAMRMFLAWLFDAAAPGTVIVIVDNGQPDEERLLSPKLSVL